MAGTYPDVPGRRMAYDADGTVVVSARPYQTPMVDVSADNMVEINDEDNTAVSALSGGTGGAERRLAFIFPELREIDGLFAAANNGNPSNYLHTFATAPDSANGVGGTWTTRITDISNANGNPVTTYDRYRSNIYSLAVSSIRAVRFYITVDQTQLISAHLYGEISAGETPDRLLFIDENTGLEFTKSYDYGDVPRGSSDDNAEMRIKNNSAGLTANTIQFTSESLYLNSGSWYLYTEPGGSTFSSVQQITSLAAATTSALIVCRRVTDGAETVGLHAARLYANVASWS